jgi:hypothetical protein
LENLNEGVGLSNSGVGVAGFKVIIGLVITVLLNDHIVLILDSVVELGSISPVLILLLLLLNVEVNDLVENG